MSRSLRSSLIFIREVITMVGSGQRGPGGDPHRGEHASHRFTLSGADAGAVQAYAAFCRDYSQVYRRYAGAVTGDAAVGRTLADAALQELGAQWPHALRIADPCALGWVLLRAATAFRRTSTVRSLQCALRPQEVDALVLHYRVGLSAARAGSAMGVSAGVFDLLRHDALRKAARLDWGLNMPRGIAV
ncbi:hypothetical protein [Streptomyces longwoodensis]|uniref:hypothetical protein n=1 Tax=Streptomyces longwoodensis TaxID=68231 RepID=UPI0033D838BE